VTFFCVTDPAASTITSSANPTANGVASTTITITVVDAAGAAVCPNVPITFTATGSNNTFTTVTGITDGSGVLTTTLTSTTAETKSVFSSTGDLGGLSVSVNFTAGPAAATYSTISAYPAYGLALGAQTTITVTLRDAYSNAVPSTSATFTSTQGTDILTQPGSTTDASGITKGTLKAPTGTGVVGDRTVTIATPSTANTVSNTVTYVTSTVDPTKSTISGTGPVNNDGSSTSTVTITLRDASSNPVPNMYAAITATDTGSTNVYSDCGLSNASGIATCTLSSKVAESKTLSLLTPVNISSASPVVFQSNFKLQVPIEMLDYGIQAAANQAQTDWARSITSLDNTAYDGSPTYAFEATCMNADSSARSVTLIDSKATPNVITTLSFPSGMTTPSSMSASFTSPGTYTAPVKIRTAAMGAGGALSCYSARIVVTQTGATKTRIFIPLTAGPTGTVSTDNTITGGALMSTLSKTLGQGTGTTPDYFTLWTKDTTALSILDTTTPWTMEALVANSASPGKSTLALTTSGGTVVGKATSGSSSATPIQMTFTISNTAAGFTEGTTLKAQYASTSSTKTAYLYKAGLWVKLTHVTSVEIPYRVGRYESTATNKTVMESRASIDTSLFRNPSTYFEVVGREPTSSQMTTSLGTLGVNDGNTTASAIGSSSIGFTSTTKTKSRTGALSITNGDRFVPMVTGTAGGNVTHTNTTVIIKAQ
jgi:adhesin/invasin